MKRVLCLLLVMAGCCAFALADVKVRGYSPKREYCLGEAVQYIVELDGDGFRLNDISIPDIKGLELVGKNQSQSFQFINGKASSTTRMIYTFVPSKAGDYEIFPVIVKVDNKEYELEKVAIKVQNCRSAPSRFPNRGPIKSTGSDEQALEGNVFGVGKLSKQKVYVGEPIILDYIIYTQVPLTIRGFHESPDFSSFIFKDVSEPNIVLQRNTTIGGKKYKEAVPYRYVLIPTMSGKYQLSLGSLVVRPRVRTQGLLRSFLDDETFNSLIDDTFNFGLNEYLLDVAPQEIEVLPLPENPPDGFLGAVGGFDLGMNVDKKSAKAGEDIKLSIVIKGKGNPGSLDKISLPKIDGLDIYPADVKINDKDIDNVVANIDFVIVGVKEGEYTLPGLSFSFFSPEEGRYITKKAEDITIEFAPNPNASAAQDASAVVDYAGPAQKPPRQQSEIMFIKDRLDRRWHALWIGFPFLAFNAVLALFIGLIKGILKGISNSGAEYSKEREAAMRLLKQAVAARRQNPSDALKFLYDALKIAIAYKTGLTRAQIDDIETARMALEPISRREDEIARWCEFYKKVSQRLFLGQADFSGLEDDIAEGEKVIKEIFKRKG